MWRWFYLTVIVASIGCSSPQVITNTEYVEVSKRDTVISFKEKIVNDTIKIVNDTIIYKDRVTVKIVNSEVLSDSLRAVISDLNLQLEVICPEEEKVVQIESKVVNKTDTVVEQKKDFFEKHWWKMLLGLFLVSVIMRLSNKFVL